MVPGRADEPLLARRLGRAPLDEVGDDGRTVVGSSSSLEFVALPGPSHETSKSVIGAPDCSSAVDTSGVVQRSDAAAQAVAFDAVAQALLPTVLTAATRT